MTNRITLPTILSGGYTSTTALNNAFRLIEQAFDNTISRDGTAPNEMNDNLDMNGSRIINLPDGIEDGEPLTMSQVRTGSFGITAKNRFVVSSEGNALDNIQHAFDAAKAAGGGVIAFEPNATYNLGGKSNSDSPFVTLYDHDGLVLEGNNALIVGTVSGAEGHKAAAFYFENCSNISASNLRFYDEGYVWDAIPDPPPSGSTAPVRGMEGFNFAVKGVNGVLYENIYIHGCFFENMATGVQFQNNDGTTSRHRHINVVGCGAKNCAYGFGAYFNGTDAYVQMTNEDVRRSLIVIGSERIRFDILSYLITTNLTLGQISLTASTLMSPGDLKDISGTIKVVGYLNSPAVQLSGQTDLTTARQVRNIDIYIDATGLTVQDADLVRIACYNIAGTLQSGASPNVDFDNISFDGSISTDYGPVTPITVQSWTSLPTYDTPGRLELKGCFAGEGVNKTRTAIPGFFGYVNGQKLFVTSSNPTQVSTTRLEVSLNKYTTGIFAFEAEVYAQSGLASDVAAHQTWSRYSVIGYKPTSGPIVMTATQIENHFVGSDAVTSIVVDGSTPDHHITAKFGAVYTGSNGFCSVKLRPLTMGA